MVKTTLFHHDKIFQQCDRRSEELQVNDQAFSSQAEQRVGEALRQRYSRALKQEVQSFFKFSDAHRD
jgi:hypothetical protein